MEMTFRLGMQQTQKRMENSVSEIENRSFQRRRLPVNHLESIVIWLWFSRMESKAAEFIRAHVIEWAF
jgi:hypothetical protein